MLDSLTGSASAGEVHRLLADDIAIDEAEIETFLDELADSGAILRHVDRAQRVPEWISFLRSPAQDLSSALFFRCCCSPARCSRSTATPRR